MKDYRIMTTRGTIEFGRKIFLGFGRGLEATLDIKERQIVDPTALWYWPMNFDIEKVIFNDPATIVLWQDGTKTVVKCQEGDAYSKELGLAMCISKKALGNKGRFNEVFKEWAYEENEDEVNR